MELDSITLDVLQPPLFEFGEATPGALELFPAVWSAAEELVSPDLASRLRGLARLEEIGAARFSPLVAYLLFTRLGDSDAELRRQVMVLLSALLVPDERGFAAPEPVRRFVTAALGQMRTRSIFGMLEVLAADPRVEGDLARLLNACPHAGHHLMDILSERKNPLAVRYAAARMLGRVGYLDAIPALERLAVRLETRRSGQQAMPFAALPASGADEVDLLPAIHEALARLNAP